MTDRAIADYGMLSDCHSAALVSGEGSIDWLCFPRFDSPSLFGRILDAEAGHWSIHPVAEFDIRRRYLPGSLVLETQFTTADGMAMVTDALVVPHDEQDGIGAGAPHVLVRVAEATEGTVEMAVEYSPRPEYGLVRPRLDAVDGDPPDAVVVTGGGADHLWLSGPPPDVVADGQAHWRILLHPGERVSFALGHSAQRDPAPLLWHQEEIGRRLDLTVQAWRQWSGRHQPHQLVGPQRVGDEIVGALLQPPRPLVLVTPRADHDHRNVSAGPQPRQRPAVLARQRGVQDHKIGHDLSTQLIAWRRLVLTRTENPARVRQPWAIAAV